MLQLRNTNLALVLLVGTVLNFSNIGYSQYCDNTVPTFNVDLSASPNMNWISPPVSRNGSCCGVVNPDKCLEFVITLNPSAIAVSFNIASGAVPPGALFYQINCGPQIPVGQPICLSGVGPHHLTFCKPGNNENTFSIISYPEPEIGPDITLNAACEGFIYGNYYDETTVNWTSIAPGNQGDYDGLLSCTSGCDTTYVTAPLNGPAYVDYLVCGSDVGGCNPNPYCDTIRVNFIAPFDVSLSSTASILCAGETTTITASASGGAGSYSYAWSNGETGSSIIASGGTYSVDVTDASGCYITTETITIQQFVDPPVVAGNDQSVCEGASVTLTASGALSYSWDQGIVNGVPFVQNVGLTVYIVTGTDVNGCVATDQVNVTVNALPVVSAGVDQTICEGASVQLNGAGAVNYTWTGGITNGVSFIPNLGSSNYTVTGIDANGCVATDVVSVFVNATPVVNAGSDITLCEGGAITLSGLGAQTYNWDNAVLNGTAFTPPLGSTVYTVTGMTAEGCSAIDDVEVTVNPLPIVEAGADQEECEGSSMILSASGATSYMWNNGISNGIPFGQPVGTTTYSVTGTDANGCSNTDQVNITIHPLPVVQAGPDIQLCENSPVVLSGSGASSYIWNNGVINSIPFTQAPGTMTYTAIGTDINGCTNTDQVDVVINALPNVSAGANQEVCAGETVTLSGMNAQSYTWTGGVTNNVPFVTSVGVHTYTVTGTDGNGCQNTAQVVVVVNSLPFVNAGPDIELCEDLSVTLSASGASTYAWNNGVVNGVSFIPNLGSTQYTVVGTNGFGCSNSDDVIVLVNPNPVVIAGADQSFCDGEWVTLSASGSQNMYWSSGISNGVPFEQNIGTYSYIVYDVFATGCSASDTVEITVLPNPVIVAQDVEICEGESATLEAFGALNYDWSNGVTNGQGFYPITSGTYAVIGTSVNGCSAVDSATVIVHPSPTAAFTWTNQELTTSTPETGFENWSTGAVSYMWDFGDYSPRSYEFEPTHSFPDVEGDGYFVTLTATSEYGCVDEATQYIEVIQDYSVFVPNAFTPDGDGVNEIFNPVMRGFEEDKYTMYIFNRWGQLVFESHDMSKGWDGSYAHKFEQVQDGVYSWKIVGTVKNTTDSKSFTGHVTLLK